MKKLTNDNFAIVNKDYKLTNGSSYAGIKLYVNLQRLLEVFGQPSVVGSGDNKQQVEWIFYDGEKVFTIYDWKESYAIHDIRFWHVGGKNITNEEILSYLNSMGIHKINGEVMIEE